MAWTPIVTTSLAAIAGQTLQAASSAWVRSSGYTADLLGQTGHTRPSAIKTDTQYECQLGGPRIQVAYEAVEAAGYIWVEVGVGGPFSVRVVTPGGGGGLLNVELLQSGVVQDVLGTLTNLLPLSNGTLDVALEQDGANARLDVRINGGAAESLVCGQWTVSGRSAFGAFADVATSNVRLTSVTALADIVVVPRTLTTTASVTAAEGSLVVQERTVTTTASMVRVGARTLSTTALMILRGQRTVSTTASLVRAAASTGPRTVFTTADVSTVALGSGTRREAFDGEQRYQFAVSYWDSVFPSFDGLSTGDGLVVALREPGPTGWALPDALRTATAAASASTFDTATANTVFTNGRVGSLVAYWDAGAPGWHGASVNGRLAYRFTGYFRNPSWFGGTGTYRFAVGGSGYVRIVLNQSTIVFEGDLSEDRFLTSGLTVTDAVAIAPGARVDVYYIQDGEVWGGYVVKLLPSSATPTAAMLRDAPVVGTGLFSDASPVSAVTLESVESLTISNSTDEMQRASFVLPLLNPQRSDHVGYEWRRQSSNDPGYLYHVESGVTLRRGRIVRMAGGYRDGVRTLFTGFIDDFTEASTGRVTVSCLGFEQRLVEQFTRNYPDRVSYMAFNYRRLSGIGEPVFGIQAYDNWPMEYAIRDLALRAGLDESLMHRPRQVERTDGTLQVVDFGGSVAHKKFRARGILPRPGVSGDPLILLERPVRYGNTGIRFTEDQPVDDTYIFAPEATRDVWSSARSIADRYGYDLRTDADGDLCLSSRNNPHTARDFTPASLGTGTSALAPSAMGGSYVALTSGPVVFTVEAARVDLVVVRAPTTGTWGFTVRRSGQIVANGTVNTQAASELFFYDARNSLDGSNSCVVTLVSGDYATYEVTLTQVSGPLWVDGVLLYHTDPNRPNLPYALSTERNAIRVTAQSATRDMRNYVIVVGRRRAVVTDSSKLDTNPENPANEFTVRAATDVASVVDPTALNFTGFPKEAVIYDSGITDDDFAEYLARTFIYRYRLPRPEANIEHTLLPSLSLRQPVYAVEEPYGTVTASYVLYVTGYTHRIGTNGVFTDIVTTSYPEFPSYEPREDIDIDTAPYDGTPTSNLQIQYTSVSNHLRTNLGLTAELVPGDNLHVVAGRSVQAGDGLAGGMPFLDLSGQPWPPLPGTLQIRPSTGSVLPATQAVAFPVGGTNGDTAYEIGIGEQTPEIELPGLNGTPTVTLRRFRLVNRFAQTPVWQEVTPALNLSPTTSEYYYTINASARSLVVTRRARTIDPRYPPPRERVLVSVTYPPVGDVSHLGWLGNTPYMHFTTVDYRPSTPRVYLPWQRGDSLGQYARNTSITNYDVRYRTRGSTTEYSGGQSPFYDPYLSELGYLVELSFTALVTGLYRISVRSVYDDTVVAWLTEPTAEATDPEAHWQFFTAGPNKSLAWDGVDQLGEWNRRQSDRYAVAAQGAFELGQKPVIGSGFYVWNREERDAGRFPPQALISGVLDATTGKPILGTGTYAKWYVLIEATNERLADLAEAGTRPAVRVTNTTSLNGTLNPASASSGAAVIYTHLPEPTKVRLTVQDFLSGSWTGAPDADATINSTKPVRIRFTMEPRPGVSALWGGRAEDVSVKLNRLVHVKGLVFDQGTLYRGENYAGSGVESRTVFSRMLHNDEHTLRFEDVGYRKGRTFKQSDSDDGTEWVFYPQDFKKDFTGVANESLEFGRYLQLEEVPGWDPKNGVSTPRSRLHLAFMAYLFYLSVYTQDRSGRYQWCINREFLDRSKILRNDYSHWLDPSNPNLAATSATYRMDWPEDPQEQFRRTVVVRQWTNETAWRTAQQARWGFPDNSIGHRLLQHKWHDHEPGTTTLNGLSWPVLGRDDWSHWHFNTPSHGGLPSGFNNMTRALGAWISSASFSYLNGWTWETGPVWHPCITRDFHPFYLVPPMVGKNARSINIGTLPALQPGDSGVNWRLNYFYGVVDYRGYVDTDTNPNSGDDEAGASVWSSPTYDDSHPYGNGSAGLKRFWPGRSVRPFLDNNNVSKDASTGYNIVANYLDYVRQDEQVHYEELRGIFSRGPRPAEGPKKLVPAGPYFINPYRYGQVRTVRAYKQPTYPRFTTDVVRWFEQKFRSEYVWENDRFFPVNAQGMMLTHAANLSLTRLELEETIFWDAGAWVGWKDDQVTAAGTAPAVSDTSFYRLLSADPDVFDGPYMPVQTGPRLSVTRDIVFHLVLVNERRQNPL